MSLYLFISFFHFFQSLFPDTFQSFKGLTGYLFPPTDTVQVHEFDLTAVFIEEDVALRVIAMPNAYLAYLRGELSYCTQDLVALRK